MNRHDFLFLFDVTDANPNGDPDAGNLPRIDPETGQGLVTDVCLKRKIRNYVELRFPEETNDEASKRHEIYFADHAVLNNTHERAYAHLGEKPVQKKLPKDAQKAMEITNFMCRNFYDIRTFGAVMTTEVNCGQVRGPVQLSFARSQDPVISSEHAITRSSVTNLRDLDKERTMGRKFTIPYGLYLAHGFVNPFLAEKTGFDKDDLELLWESLTNAFQFDASAARPAGSMAARGLIVFKHDSKLGNAPSHKLFDLVTVKRKDDSKPPRAFSDYEVTLDKDAVPAGVEPLEML